MKNISGAAQDYLKIIYDLIQSDGEASTTALAIRLKIAPASVTGMLQRMAAADHPLVIYRKGQGVTLTEEGERRALEVIRHHRLIETYLVRALGYSWDAVHEEACRLEHVISEDLEQRIAAFLGNPQRDPHGEVIPTSDLELKRDTSLPLAGLRPTQRAIVTRVRADDCELLRYLENLGLKPGVTLEVTNFSPFDENLSISIEGGKEIVVGGLVSKQVFVDLI